MPTSSLSKDFIINSKEEASNLAKMLSVLLTKPREIKAPTYKTLTVEQARELLHKSEEKNDK